MSLPFDTEQAVYFYWMWDDRYLFIVNDVTYIYSDPARGGDQSVRVARYSYQELEDMSYEELIAIPEANPWSDGGTFHNIHHFIGSNAYYVE